MSTSNADSVVTAWLTSDERRQAWAQRAWDLSPSTLNDTIGSAFAEVQRAIDKAADELVHIGFLPSHPIVRRLRGQASDAAAEATRSGLWASELRAAEARHAADDT